jgi:hypothetical protein
LPRRRQRLLIAFTKRRTDTNAVIGIEMEGMAEMFIGIEIEGGAEMFIVF